MRFLVAIVLFLSIADKLFAQQDTIWTKDDNLIVGEVKSMDRGVVNIETSYSDKDFAIEWDGIKTMKTVSEFMITTSDGARHIGSFETDSLGYAEITSPEGYEQRVEFKEIVYMTSVDRGFWSRLYGSIEIGYSYTKANNLQQLTSRSNVGYIAETWSANLTYNTLQSTQDSVDPIERTDGEAAVKVFLPRDWYVTLQSNFLSNTEQKLELRSNLKLGLGKFLIHTNKAYWNFVGGAAYNLERFTTEDPERRSWEGFFGTELNLYDIGDLNLLTNIIAYPGITATGRWRADGQFDLKYDFPLDFFIKLGFSMNYDNQPVEGASELDYVFQTTVGWEY